MAKEIERKFLLSGSIPVPEGFSKSEIKQGYILAEKGKQVRVRIAKGKGLLCVKFTDGVLRDEFEYEIPVKDAKEIFSKCTATLEKKRLSFKIDKETYDVDTYPNGLTFVEVEFKSMKDLEKWEKPSWIGEEISGKKKYSNIELAKENLKFKHV